MIIFISAFWVLVSSSAVVTSLGGGTVRRVRSSVRWQFPTGLLSSVLSILPPPPPLPLLALFSGPFTPLPTKSRNKEQQQQEDTWLCLLSSDWEKEELSSFHLSLSVGTECLSPALTCLHGAAGEKLQPDCNPAPFNVTVKTETWILTSLTSLTPNIQKTLHLLLTTNCWKLFNSRADVRFHEQSEAVPLRSMG